MKDLAEPLPTMAIAELLGVPAADYQIFKEWSQTLIAISNMSPQAPPPPGFEETLAAERAYFKARHEELLRKPGNDLMSMLIQAQEKDALSFDEVAGFFTRCYWQAMKPPPTLSVTGSNALMRHPEQLQALHRAQALMPGAIVEILRWNCPDGTSP